MSFKLKIQGLQLAISKIKNNLELESEIKRRLIYDINGRIKSLKKIEQKFKCECGGFFTAGSKSAHFKSQRHIIFSHTGPAGHPSASSLMTSTVTF